MHSAQVGDARKIARTLPESALKALRSASMFARFSCGTALPLRPQPARAPAAASVGMTLCMRMGIATTSEIGSDVWRQSAWLLGKHEAQHQRRGPGHGTDPERE